MKLTTAAITLAAAALALACGAEPPTVTNCQGAITGLAPRRTIDLALEARCGVAVNGAAMTVVVAHSAGDIVVEVPKLGEVEGGTVPLYPATHAQVHMGLCSTAPGYAIPKPPAPGELLLVQRLDGGVDVHIDTPIWCFGIGGGGFKQLTLDAEIAP